MLSTRTKRFAATILASVSCISLAHAGELSGNISDGSETKNLQAASVKIVELDRVASSDREGNYIFADIPAGDYTLEVSYVGAVMTSRNITIAEDGRTVENFTLASSSENYILVIGQAANQASALARQREADGVSSVLTRDAIGQFPDQNVAESLRRLPGVNILNDQGEGRFVSVRGLDPELNSSSLNGVRLPSPESDVRAVALDVISSDIIESIEVKKSLTPDMDADTIGASIEIKTTSAFDRKKDLLTGRVEGSWNHYSGEVTPKLGLDFSKRLGYDFGVAGGISYYRREFESDNVETPGWDRSKSGVDYTEEVEYRDYDVERERLSTSLSLDWRASDTTKAFVRGSWSQFEDQEFRRRTTFKFDKAPSSGDVNGAVFDDADGEIEIERDMKDRYEKQIIRSVSVGSETDSGTWVFDWLASWSKSSEREGKSLDPTRFANVWDNDGLVIGWDYSDDRIPLYNLSGVSAGEVNDPSEYGFDKVELTDRSYSQDEEWALKADLARRFAMDGGEFTVQAGAKMRWRDKGYDFDGLFYSDYNGDYSLADVLGSQTYGIADIGPVTSYLGPTDFFNDNRANFELNQVDTQFESNVEDYRVTEDIFASYFLGRWDSSNFRVIGGLRYEDTSNEIYANQTLLVEEDGTLPDGSIATEDRVLVTPVEIGKDYDHWLPSLTLRYEAAPDVILRAAGYRSLVRPKLSKLAPRFIIEQNDKDKREGEFGNPDLEPYEAWNFDASAEYYFSSNGAISAGFFYKDVKNFIVDTVIDEPGIYNDIAYDEAQIPINGPSAEIYGVEFSVAHSFDMLPEPFDGLLAQANYTWTDASGLVPDGDFDDPDSVDVFREIALPSSSKHTFNLVLGYEKGPIDLRVAGSYRSKYLDEIGGAADEDRYIDNHFQLDMSAKYKITDNIRLYAEWVNINDAKYFAYQNYNGRQRLYQFEQYGSTVKFGAKVNF